MVARNDADGNAAFGISAGEFVIDGGGNTASGNGEPVQCVGVVCTTGGGAPGPVADLTAPDTILLATPVDGGSTLDEQVFRFVGEDAVAPATALRYECRLDAPPDGPAEPPEPGDPPQPPDSESWRECGSPTSYALLTPGAHTFEVRAIDPFDNIDLTPATFTWEVVSGPPGPDAVPPSTTIFSAPTEVGLPDPASAATLDAEFAFRGSTTRRPDRI